MNNLLSQKQAINIVLSLLIIILIFHASVLIGVIPYSIVWAGKIDSLEDMRMLEAISICINSFSILIFLLKADYIHNKIPNRMLNAIILLLAVFFSLNTIGNLFAKSKFELFLFTPITFISAILCFQIVYSSKNILFVSHDNFNAPEQTENKL